MQCRFDSEDEVRPLLVTSHAAASTSSTAPSLTSSNRITETATTNRPEKVQWIKGNFPPIQKHSPTSSDRSRGRISLDVGDDFGEDVSFRTLFRKFRTTVRRIVLHPSSVSPLFFHHSYLPHSDTEHDLGDLVDHPTSRSSRVSFSAFSRGVSWLRNQLCTIQGHSLVAGLSFRGCVGEMQGTFLVAFFVHVVSRAVSLGSRNVGESEEENGKDSFFNGWAIAARLPLLLYAVAAILGFFCNPAFLYAGYTAFSRASTSTACDASRMNCFSVNLLVCLQYLAAGVGAFFGLYLLPLDTNAEMTVKQDILGSQLAWPALTEALGACLMGAAVLQLITLSSFFRNSRQEVSSLSLTHQPVDSPLDEEVSKSLFPTSSSLRRSFFTRPFLFFGRKQDQVASVSSSPAKTQGKPPAWAVASPFFLLLLAFSLPASHSSFNPAIAYMSSCAQRGATSVLSQRGVGIHSGMWMSGSSGSAFDGGAQDRSSGGRTPGADPQMASSAMSGGVLELTPTHKDSTTRMGQVSVGREPNGTFIELDSSSSVDTLPQPPGIVSSHVQSSSNSASLPLTASSSIPSPSPSVAASVLSSLPTVASSTPRLPGVVAMSLLDVNGEKTEAEGARNEQEGQALFAGDSEFFDGETEEVGGFPTFLLPPGIEEEKDVEGIHILGREEGDGEILFEFDEACATAFPWFSFFLLFSAAPYFGAFAAAVLWKRFGGVEKHFGLQQNGALNSSSV